MMRWIRRILREIVIDIVTSDIQIGGHCGCCGKWVPDILIDNSWPWTICDECINTSKDGGDKNSNAIRRVGST